MSVIKANRILVRYDKKYGVIDLAEKTIIPIKYKKFNEISDGIFLTKLNGYWGVLDINNNILINNDCEMIKPLYETLVIKRYGKYGLADLNGKILYEPKYKKIKRLGEYILVKDGKNYFVLDFEGQKVFDESYKYVRLERNRLKVKSSQKSWINIK